MGDERDQGAWCEIHMEINRKFLEFKKKNKDPDVMLGDKELQKMPPSLFFGGPLLLAMPE